MNVDKGFFLNYNVEPGEPDSFRLFLTTHRLLNLLKFSKIATTHATYKLIWNGFPCIIAGVLDNNKSFHLVGFVLCDSEDTDDFWFVFDSFHSCNPDFKHRFLVADGAEAIYQGFKVIFDIYLNILKTNINSDNKVIN